MARIAAFQAVDGGSNPPGRTILNSIQFNLRIMRYRTFKKRREENKKIALERIEILEKMKSKYPDYSKRYGEIIARIRKKYRLDSFKN